MAGFGINNAVTGFVANTQAWQDQMKEKRGIELSAQRESNSKIAFQNSLNATSDELKNNYNSMCNNELLASAIVLAAQAHGVNDYNNLESSAVIDRFLRKNPNKNYEQYVNDCTQGKITLGEAVKGLKLDVVSNTANTTQNNTTSQRINPLTMDANYGAGSSAGGVDYTALALGGGAVVGGLVGSETVYGLGKASGKVGKSWMEQVYKPTQNQKSYKQYLDAKIIQAQDDVKDAKKGLKLAEKNLKNAEKRKAVTDDLLEGVESAKEVLKNAEDALNSAKESKKTLRTVADTAYDYGIGDFRNGSIFNDKGGAVARARANEIFDDVLNPIFMADDATTINVMNRVEELGDLIPTLTKDPGRQQDLFEAWAAMLEEYGGKGFESYSLKDVQKLKSDLQKDVPEKFWKGKNIASAYKELKAELSRLIREDLVEELDKALASGKFPSLEGTKYAGKDAATLYRDWANLDEIADRALVYKIPGVDFPYLGRLEGDIAGPTQKTIVTSLRKYGDAMDDSKFGKAMKKINSSIGNMFKKSKALKILGSLGAVLGVFGGVLDAAEMGSTGDAMREWFDDLYRIRSKYLKLGEFEGKTDEEAEEMFPESEVVETLRAIDNNEEFNNRYNTWNEDLFGRKKIDLDKYRDYVGGRLKNVGKTPEDQYRELKQNNASPVEDRSPLGEIEKNKKALKNK